MKYEYIIETEDLTKHYNIGGVTIKALDGVSLKIRRGEYLSIVGPSGSGKTTLFNMMGGLDRPTRGEIFIDEMDVSKLDAYELAWLRCRKVGYIFQTFNLIPVLTAIENISLPMIFAGLPKLYRGRLSASAGVKLGILPYSAAVFRAALTFSSGVP